MPEATSPSHNAGKANFYEKANRALHMICVVRMGSDERTRRYVSRRTAEGKSKWEIMRCLKRYIAREVYRVLLASAATELPPSEITKPLLGAEIP